MPNKKSTTSRTNASGGNSGRSKADPKKRSVAGGQSSKSAVKTAATKGSGAKTGAARTATTSPATKAGSSKSGSSKAAGAKTSPSAAETAKLKAGEAAGKAKDAAKGAAKGVAKASTGKKVAMAVGAAAAVAAGVAAVRAVGGGKRTVYEVKPRDEGWEVKQEGASRASSVHGTKKEALSAGRDLANRKAPSELRIYKADGGVEDTHSYEPAEAG